MDKDIPKTLNSMENMRQWSNFFPILCALSLDGPDGSCQGFLKHSTNWPTLFIHNSLFWRRLLVLFLLISRVWLCEEVNETFTGVCKHFRRDKCKFGAFLSRPVWTKRLLLCNQACFVSFSLNLKCPLKRIVLLHEIWSRRSVASRRDRNLGLLRRSSWVLFHRCGSLSPGDCTFSKELPIRGKWKKYTILN